MNNQGRQKIKVINTETMEFEVLETLNKGERIKFTNEETDIYSALSNEIEKSKKEILEKIKEENKVDIINDFKANNNEYKTLLDDSTKLKELISNKDKEAQRCKLEGVEEYKKTSEFVNMKNDLENIRIDLEKANIELTKLQADQKRAKEAIISEFKESATYKNLVQELNDKKIDIATLEKEKKIIAEQAVDKFKLSNEYKKFEEIIKEKDKNIMALNYELEKKDKEKELALSQKDKDFEDYKYRNRWSSTKVMGQAFEDWFKTQFDQHFSFNERMSLNPITKSKSSEEDEKGTKADFLLEIYKDEQRKPDELLLKAVFELKTQDDHSEIKTKNKDHYKKLNSDRNKEKAKIAILVSELEPEDDFIFRKVRDFEDMYVIRPAHAIAFIDVLLYLAKVELELKEIGVSSMKESKQIASEIEDFKNKVEKIFEKAADQFKKINKSSDNIIKEANIIKDITSKNIEDGFEKIKKDISKLTVYKVK